MGKRKGIFIFYSVWDKTDQIFFIRSTISMAAIAES